MTRRLRALAVPTAGAVLVALLPVLLPQAAAEPTAVGRAFAADGLVATGAPPRRVVRAGAGTTRTAAPSAALQASVEGEPTAQFVVTYTGFTAAQQASFQKAVDTWSHLVVSSVPIRVSARLSSSLGDGVLGSAGPANAFRSGGSYYAVALANSLAGRDLDTSRVDIEAEFTNDASLLHFGTDGRPPAGRYDFPTVVLHEIGHGLGFLGGAEVVNGLGTYDPGSTTPTPFVWDRLTARRTSTGFTPILDYPRGSTALAQALQSGEVFWRGASATTAAGTSPELYAPAQWEPGSSYGHLDEVAFAPGSSNALMTPFVDRQEVLADPGPVTLGIMEDQGWRLSSAADPTPSASPSPSSTFAPSASPSPSATPTAGSRYTALAPRRVLDTRDGTGARTGRVGAGQTVDLTVTGSGVPASASAVVLNVTGVSATTSTDVRVYPVRSGGPVPEASNLNLAAGQTRANLVTVAVGDLGQVRLRNSTGTVHLLADLAGYYDPAGDVGFFPLDPERVLDTRTRSGATTVGPGGVLDLRVAGTTLVPGSARAVVLGVTAVGATRSTDVRVFPLRSGSPTPTVSSLNVVPGGPVPNLVVVQVGDSGTVRLRNSSGEVSLLADLYGYYDVGGGSLFRAVTPSRLLDTRPARPGPRSVVDVATADRGGVPAGATAVALNVTGVGASASTDVRVFPTPLSGTTQVPTVSTLNLVRGQTAADAAVVRTGNGGSVRLYNGSGTVALVVDVAGWFGP